MSSKTADQREKISIRDVIAQNIRDLRRNLGISQEDLADNAGLHRTYIGSVERGERNISLENILKISRALNTKAADLFRGEENAETP